MSISALNNSSISPDMSLDDILAAADRRLGRIIEESHESLGDLKPLIKEHRNLLLNTARATLPPSLRACVRLNGHTDPNAFPNHVSVSIELPDTERIFYGPWVLDESMDTYEIDEPWRNKPFEIAGGNHEIFGDLLDAIARAREVFWSHQPFH